MIDTHLFYDKEQWIKTKKKYWKDTRYYKFTIIHEPTSFPCIAIEDIELNGELGTITTIDTFIYPSDFS
jgi:fumarate reductase subunit C